MEPKQKQGIAEAGLAPRLGRGDGGSNPSTLTFISEWS